VTTRGRGGSSGAGQVFGEGNNLIMKNMSHKSHRNVAQVTQKCRTSHTRPAVVPEID